MTNSSGAPDDPGFDGSTILLDLEQNYMCFIELGIFFHHRK